MTLLPSLLRELENPNLSVDSRAELYCEAAKGARVKSCGNSFSASSLV
jgi:hypothetical protein